MTPSIETIALFREVAGRKPFKKYVFEPSFKEAKYCDDLDEEKDKYIRIPNSITAIGKDAFYHCESLKKIVIPNHGLASPYSVTSIGYCAFSNCTSLKEIIIPKGVTNIGNYAFYDCKNLKEIVIPSSVTHIGTNVFPKWTKVIYEWDKWF